MIERKRGFTLIEVLVVLAIISTLLSFLLAGYIQFKSAIEVKEAAVQIEDTLNLLKNAAKNDVRTTSSALDAFDFKGFKYDFDSQSVLACSEELSGTGNVINEWSCSVDRNLQNTLIPLNFPINIDTGSDFTSNFGIIRCRAIYFESLTADILVEDNLGNIKNNQDCYIPVTDSGETRTMYVYIDALTDTYKIAAALNDL